MFPPSSVYLSKSQVQQMSLVNKAWSKCSTENSKKHEDKGQPRYSACQSLFDWAINKSANWFLCIWTIKREISNWKRESNRSCALQGKYCLSCFRCVIQPPEIIRIARGCDFCYKKGKSSMLWQRSIQSIDLYRRHRKKSMPKTYVASWQRHFSATGRSKSLNKNPSLTSPPWLIM